MCDRTLKSGVAVGKVSQVICVVAEHIFSTKLKSNMLPSHTTVTHISDEAQYLVKLYTAEIIEASDHYGWNKDGTTKKKIKILENSITLPSGQTLHTGFHKAARETADAITEGVQTELHELSAILHDTDLGKSEVN